MNTWRDAHRPRDLFEFISVDDAADRREPAARRSTCAVTAYILQANGAPAGDAGVHARRRQCRSAAIATGATPTGRPRRRAAGGRGAAPAAARARRPAAGRAPGGGRGGAPANAGPLGLTVAGEVKNYVPVTDEMLRNPDPGDWLMARRNYQGWSYSPLTQITRDNVKDLQLAWVWAMNEGGANQPIAARAQRHHVSRATPATSCRRSTRRPAT